MRVSGAEPQAKRPLHAVSGGPILDGTWPEMPHKPGGGGSWMMYNLALAGPVRDHAKDELEVNFTR